MVAFRFALTISAVISIAAAAALPQVKAVSVLPHGIVSIDPESLNIPDTYVPPVAEELEIVESPTAARLGKPKCAKVLKRRAWHKLSNVEKKSYLDAVVCLMNKPTRTNLPHAKTLYDDYIKQHQALASVVHGDGWFLPFHRAMMASYESNLRSECGYTGAQPYWDQPRDAGNFAGSDIFDPVYGFGGNGSGYEACITTGPFANYTLHTGPGYQNGVPHCIWRRFDELSSPASAQKFINRCMVLDNFVDFRPCIEDGILPGQDAVIFPDFIFSGEVPFWPPGESLPGEGTDLVALKLASPHNGGHLGVGGEMANPVSSPGDPLFYMHHAFIDRIWWQWQKRDLKKRVKDIAGYTSRFPIPGVGYINATLNDVIDNMGLAPNITIGEVMDSRAWPLCVDYD